MPTAENHTQIAIKSFSEYDDFKKEMDNLGKIQALNHPHLIQHIATVQQGTRFYAIFDWADGGDLTDFWRRDSKAFQTRGPELVVWCFQQMLGLVDALFVLHEMNYRHGDLKPGNILHFKDSKNSDVPHSKYGRLVITDVGISKYHHQVTEFRRGGTNTTASTLDYEAPEAELDRDKPEGEKEPRSRKYDMWSVGCILKEFIIWLLYGNKPIEDFRKIRKRGSDKAPYYTVANTKTGAATVKNAEIHPAVSRGFKALKEDPRCAESTGLAALVSLIENHLIVIKPEKRATAHQLRDELRKILRKADDGFLTESIESPTSIPSTFKFTVKQDGNY